MAKDGGSQHNDEHGNGVGETSEALDDATLIRHALPLQRWKQACEWSLLLTIQLFNAPHGSNYEIVIGVSNQHDFCEVQSRLDANLNTISVVYVMNKINYFERINENKH